MSTAERDALGDLLAWRDEPLSEALQPYLDETPVGPSLRHPLVYEVPLTLPGMANRIYVQKVEALAQAVAERDWARVIFLHERPYRLQALLDHRDRIDDDDFAPLAADVWIDSENIWQCLTEWQEIFSEHPRLFRGCMSEEEHAALDALPDPVPVYRGAQTGINEDGLSFTVDYDRAVWFARRRLNDDEPVVIVGTVGKSDVVAYFANRGEAEIVVAAPDAVQVTGRSVAGMRGAGG